MSKPNFKFDIGDVVFYAKKDKIVCAGIVTKQNQNEVKENYYENYYEINDNINLYESDLYETKQDVLLNQLFKNKPNIGKLYDEVIKSIIKRNDDICEYLFSDNKKVDNIIINTMPFELTVQVDFDDRGNYRVVNKTFDKLRIRKYKNDVTFYAYEFIPVNDIDFSNIITANSIIRPYPVELDINEILEEHIKGITE